MRGLLQVRQRGAGAQEHGPRVHPLDQVVALGRRVFDVRQRDGPGVVDQHVQAAEARRRRRQRRFHGPLVAHVQLHGERLAAGGLDGFGGVVDRAGQFRVRLVALGGDDHVGTAAAQPHGDRAADAPAGSGDEHGAA